MTRDEQRAIEVRIQHHDARPARHRLNPLGDVVITNSL
jgi:hypothetical protein